MSESQELQDEASLLRSEIDNLRKIIYMNGAIKDFNDFEQLLKKDDPQIIERLRQHYLPALEVAILQLKDLSSRVAEFEQRVHRGSSNVVKFGQFKTAIDNKVNNLLDTANAIMNRWMNHKVGIHYYQKKS